jgi:hypothetical protein
LIFDCVINVEFYLSKFELPLNAGLPSFFLNIIFNELNTILATPQWVPIILDFLSSCISDGDPDLVTPLFEEFPIVDLVLLLLDEPPQTRVLQEIRLVLEESGRVLDHAKGNLCAIATRALQLNSDLVAEFSARNVFRSLIEQLDGEVTYRCRIRAVGFLSVAFQILSSSELEEFIVSDVIELFDILNIVDAAEENPDFLRDVARAIFRMNSMIPDDCELKEQVQAILPREEVTQWFENSEIS